MRATFSSARRRKLTARSPRIHAAVDRHQFGGAIGGALVIPKLYDGHSRTFFFSDYAGIRERRGITTVNTVPTAAARTVT